MGGLIQLVAYGAQNAYLTGTPDMTFFKSVFRRHTNFAIESIKQIIDGDSSHSEFEVSSIVSRSGDLLSKVWVEANLPYIEGNFAEPDNVTYTSWCNNTGCAFLKECSIDIGGQQIDKMDSIWMDVNNELNERDKLVKNMTNKKSAFSNTNGNKFVPLLHMMIPLDFWFCKNTGNALPLIALQYHEVKLNLSFRALENLIVSSHKTLAGISTPPDISLWCDYIFLDEEERTRFSQSKHSYLIEQHQYSEEEIAGTQYQDVDLFFTHPVKEMIWVFTDSIRNYEMNSSQNVADPTTFAAPRLHPNGNIIQTIGIEGDGNDYFNYQSCWDNTIIKASVSGSSIGGRDVMENFGTMVLTMNGHNRFEPRNAAYFRTIQPHQAKHEIPEKHIYCYSFSLNPREYQPSGSCNFSRLDTVQMQFSNLGTKPRRLRVYVINYNILQIVGGLGGLAFAH